MAIYLITFNLARNHTYADRIARLHAEIQRDPWWGETGSVMVCESEEPIDTFCGRVLNARSFDEVCDIAVIFDMESGDARSKGRLRDYSLYNIVPRLKRL